MNDKLSDTKCHNCQSTICLRQTAKINHGCDTTPMWAKDSSTRRTGRLDCNGCEVVEVDMSPTECRVMAKRQRFKTLRSRSRAEWIASDDQQAGNAQGSKRETARLWNFCDGIVHGAYIPH